MSVWNGATVFGFFEGDCFIALAMTLLFGDCFVALAVVAVLLSGDCFVVPLLAITSPRWFVDVLCTYHTTPPMMAVSVSALMERSFFINVI